MRSLLAISVVGCVVVFGGAAVNAEPLDRTHRPFAAARRAFFSALSGGANPTAADVDLRCPAAETG